MIKILETFFEQWDSGGAVACVAPILVRCLSGQPLSPLTGGEDEWRDPMGDGSMLQNVRRSSVFKDWRNPDGSLSRVRGGGDAKLTIHDIDNPSWDGSFPYNPSTRLPGHPVMILDVGDSDDTQAAAGFPAHD